MQDINPAIVEAVARAGFATGAAIAAREFGLDKPVTWDEHLTDTDRERELARTRAMLSAAYPLIAAKAKGELIAILGYSARFWPKVEVGSKSECWIAEVRDRADCIERGES